MPVVVLVVVAAVVAGRLRGGSLTRLSTLALPGWQLVALAVAAQGGGALAVARGAPGSAYAVALVVSALLVTGFVVLNRGLAGMSLVAAGFALNALVVSANGGMPVSLWAAARAGIQVAPIVSGSGRHEVAGAATRLRPLGDVVPAPLPWSPLSSVLSPGDVVLSAGLGVLVSSAMAPPPGTRRRRQTRSWASA